MLIEKRMKMNLKKADITDINEKFNKMLKIIENEKLRSQ